MKPLKSSENERLRLLLEQSLVIDAESNLSPRFFQPDGPKPSGWDDIVKSGLTAMQATVGAYGSQSFTFFNLIRDLGLWGYRFEVYRDYLLRVTRSDDILRAKQEKKLGILIGIQNAEALGTNLEQVDICYGLGIRLIQLTYNYRNQVGDGCLERANGGLTVFGIELIERMNQLGIILDLSHCGHRTTLEAIDASRLPAVFSHTAAWTLCENPRNKLDEELLALAKKGGVVNVYAVPFWLTKKKRATIKDLFDHIDYLVRLLGIDHVGIGTDRPDFDPKEASRKKWEAEWWKAHAIFNFPKSLRIKWPPYTKGIEYISKWPNIVAGLIERGYSDEDISKIIGNNFFRVIKQVIG